VQPKLLDHVAFWVADRDPIVARCERYLGMHVIDRQSTFTLVGADARHGKLTFFDAEGPREPGLFRCLGLRVSSLDRARALLPAATPVELELGEGVFVRLVEAPTEVEYDLDHVTLLSPDPVATALEYERLGFRLDGEARVEVGGGFVEFEQGMPEPTERPLLNHLAVLVDSAEQHRVEAERLGIEVEQFVEAANTFAVFLRGPDDVRVEYVEQKPTFALA
jgi:catechol 2,3-dioxygenase-like lactoylglutathione lyase family enzyme